MEKVNVPVGRFAPSPSGRMHLGNIFTAVLSWLSVRSRGGRWVLRIEDLDPQRSKRCHAEMIEDDLRWLGLDWDEGGLDGIGPSGPYMQSLRDEIYGYYLARLVATGYTYPCRCTRADLMAVRAPHQSDGRLIYPGTCRPAHLPSTPVGDATGAALRLYVPDEEIAYRDGVFGMRRYNLARECGDFVVRRADGAWSYQLAVVVDDALMGVTEVMRGCDLLLFAAQQIYLRRLLGLPDHEYVHLPLVCNNAGQRLSKRDSSMSMEHLRRIYSPGQILGIVASLSGIKPGSGAVGLDELLEMYDRRAIPATESVVVSDDGQDSGMI